MNIVMIILALVVSFGAGAYIGHDAGRNKQKVADQIEFDRINDEREQQKTEANDKYREQQKVNLALMVERDQLKTTLETEREDNRKKTDDLRARYAGLGLRFAAPKGSGYWHGSGCAQGAAADPAGADGAAIVQLPDALTASLRQLVYDADKLADDYRECYAWAQQVR